MAIDHDERDAAVLAGLPAPIDPDELPITEYLVMEVLAARHRLGESLWTFPAGTARTLNSLQAKDLVRVMPGIVEHTRRAMLSDLGRELFLSEDYAPPAPR